MRRVQPDSRALLHLGNVHRERHTTDLYLLDSYPIMTRQPVKPVTAVKPAQVVVVHPAERREVVKCDVTLIDFNIMGMGMPAVEAIGDLFGGYAADVTRRLPRHFDNFLVCHIPPTLGQQTECYA